MTTRGTHPRTLSLPKGTVIPVDLPEYCDWPVGTDGTPYAAALSTPLFPVLKGQIVTAIQKGLDEWHS